MSPFATTIRGHLSLPQSPNTMLIGRHCDQTVKRRDDIYNIFILITLLTRLSWYKEADLVAFVRQVRSKYVAAAATAARE